MAEKMLSAIPIKVGIMAMMERALMMDALYIIIFLQKVILLLVRN
jgi:hypothetical protein